MSYITETNCSNCSYFTKVTEFEVLTREGKLKFKFCDICAGTYLSRATTNPEQYSQQNTLFMSLGYIANTILDEIRKASKNENL